MRRSCDGCYWGSPIDGTGYIECCRDPKYVLRNKRHGACRWYATEADLVAEAEEAVTRSKAFEAIAALARRMSDEDPR